MNELNYDCYIRYKCTFHKVNIVKPYYLSNHVNLEVKHMNIELKQMKHIFFGFPNHSIVKLCQSIYIPYSFLQYSFPF